MTSQLAGARNLNPIRLARVQNASPAEGQIAGDIAAYNRWLAEYGGGARVQGQEPISPPTPIYGNTLPGHDHSGGIMGKPQKHTVWHSMFGALDSSACDFEVAPFVQVISSGEKLVLADCEPRGVWIPGGRAYQRLQFFVRLWCASNASDYSLEVRTAAGQSYTKTGTLSVNENDITVDDVPFIPGRLQNFYYKIQISYTGATSTVSLFAAALNQTASTP